MSKKKRKEADLTGFVEQPVEEHSSAVETHNQEEKEHHNNEHAKKPSAFSSSHIKLMVIILLSLAVVVMAIVIAVQSSPLYKSIEQLKAYYPNGVMSIQMVTGDRIEQVVSNLETVCPGLGMVEYYLVQTGDYDNPAKRINLIEMNSGKVSCSFMPEPMAQTGSGVSPQLLATVNGEQVLTGEVLQIYNSLPEQQRTQATLQQAFEQVVNNKLLLQDAAKKGVTATPSEIDASISSFMTTNGLSLEQLEANLQKSGSNLQMFRETVKNELTLQKMVQGITANAPAATDQEAQAYYGQYKENITSIPSSVSHQMTFYANDSNAAERLEYVNQTAQLINQTNFCDIVKRYSEDIGSRDQCGLVSAKAGTLLPEYEEAVFASNPGDRKIIATRIGFHIIEVVSISPARKLSYEESVSDIKNYITLVKKQNALVEYMTGLRESAKIVNLAQETQ